MSNFMNASRLPSSDPRADAGTGARYTIRLAARRSGITAHTLRAWERRYGFPSPARTSGGARRYSDADIERLQLIARALDAGFRAGDVVPSSLDQLRALLGERSPARSLAAEGTRDLVTQTVDAAQRDEVEAVRREMRRAATLLGPKRFVTEFAQPLAVELGHRWRQGVLSIQQEHLTSDALRTRLRVLIAGYESPDGTPRVLLATLPGERHTLAMEMVALYINLCGGAASSLGTAAPIEEIAAAAAKLRVDAVGVSISGSYNRDEAHARLVALRARLSPPIALWIGGQGALSLSGSELGATPFAKWSDLDAALGA